MNVKRGVRLLLIGVASGAVGFLLSFVASLATTNPSDVITALALLGLGAGVVLFLAGVVVLLGSAWKWSRR